MKKVDYTNQGVIDDLKARAAVRHSEMLVAAVNTQAELMKALVTAVGTMIEPDDESDG